jgi:hypothetical protein
MQIFAATQLPKLPSLHHVTGGGARGLMQNEQNWGEERFWVQMVLEWP